MDDRRITSSSRSSAADVARANFTTVRKGGLDPNEVRMHLEAVARETGLLESRIRELQEQLSAANRRADNPVLDEAELASRLGAQSANILRVAHEEAARVSAEAQERATKVFADGQSRVAEVMIEAQERATNIVREAELAAEAHEAEARAGAERLVGSAKINAESLVDQARDQGRAIVEQASEARKAMLNDLAIKRKALMIQIDQLQAARDSLGVFIQTTHSQIEGLLAGVAASDEVAKQAALEALRVRPTTPELSEAELIGATPLREVAEVRLHVVEGGQAPSKAPKARPKGKGEPEIALEDDPASTDVVNDLFARLRASTAEERGVAEAKKTEPKKTSPVPGAEIFDRRDAALADALASLVRKVKRALQDDQNIMLERLRGVQGLIIDEMEDEMLQRARYVEAATDALAEAGTAGAAFAAQHAGIATAPLDLVALQECAADLAVTVSLALRKRILADGAGSGEDRVDSAYREWRGARVERLCHDLALRAFHLGVLATSSGRSVRFVAAPGDAPCDACQLNAASGERSAGANFPSGTPYPPIHAGCACLVLPA